MMVKGSLVGASIAWDIWGIRTEISVVGRTLIRSGIIKLGTNKISCRQ